MCFVGAKSTLDVDLVLVCEVVLAVFVMFLGCVDLGTSCGRA